MAVYVAMEPPGADRENAVFVRDGFTLPAFLVPVVWFLWHRMWIEAVLALALTLLLGSLDALGGLAAPLASLLVSLVIGLEAPTLRLWALRRRGWRERGVAEAENAADAEVRFFLAGGTDAPPAAGRRARAGEPVLGLLDRRSIA
jgi:hypothetical protein